MEVSCHFHFILCSAPPCIFSYTRLVARKLKKMARRNARRELFPQTPAQIQRAMLNPMGLTPLEAAAVTAGGMYHLAKKRKASGTPVRKKVTVKKPAAKKKKGVRGAPIVRVGKSMGVFGKKGRKPMPMKGVTLRRDETFDGYSTGNQQVGTCYFGALYGCSSADILRTICMKIVQDICKANGTTITTWEGQMPHSMDPGSHIENSRFHSCTFQYYRTKRDGDYQKDIGTAIQLNPNDTYMTMVDSIRNQFRTFAQKGYIPFEMVLKDDINNAYRQFNKIDEIMVTLYMESKHKIQNLTAATAVSTGGGQMDINAIDANPVQGRIYDFGHSTPRLGRAFVSQASQVTGYQDIGKLAATTASDANNNFGGNFVNTLWLRAHGAADPTASDTLYRTFTQPPQGAAVFDNCTGAKNVSMPPGGFYTVKRTHKVKASLKRILQSLIPLDPAQTGSAELKGVASVPVVHKSFMIGLEPSVRSSPTEKVSILVNREVTCKVSFKYAKIRNSPAYTMVI
ncbi:MAG: putative capsid protein [Cressdnaviricota sp.]|nr:MAG: putative capsid protein [Cressdnaviricota sp.]